MSHVEALVLTKAAAMGRAAQSIEIAQAGGLPDIDYQVITHADGLPKIMVHTPHAVEWALHLWLKRMQNINYATGEIEFVGVVNGVRWSITVLKDEDPRSVDWSGPVHRTMVIDGGSA